MAMRKVSYILKYFNDHNILVSDPVFFSVASNREVTYNSGDTIHFHHTFSNVNPGFPGWNPATNMFTCPYSGYYMFVATLYRGGGPEYEKHNYQAQLTMSEGGDLTRMYNFLSDSHHGSVTYSSSMSAIVPCHQAENVWVEMRTFDGVTLNECSTCYYNQFSGWLMKEGLE